MTKLEITKKIVSGVVGIGTGKIVGSIIKNNVSPQNIPDVVTVWTASVVIGSMASDATRNYTDAKIDEIADWWKKNVTEKTSK